ncbi:MAG: hypothetical protein IKA79_00960, partial [Lentisphaeria bacterium]|nr:hypothetical protein [Lentisphaeria bacterium]
SETKKEAKQPAKTSVPVKKEEKKDNNLIPEKFRSFYPVTRNGRSAKIKVTAKKSYLIRASLKMDSASTNPATAMRFVIREEGKRGYKTMQWHKLTAEKFTIISCIYTPSANVTEATIILKPRFTAEEKARCKDFSAIETSGELDEE